MLLRCTWSGLIEIGASSTGKQPLPATPALAVVFATFCAHARFFQRRVYEREDTHLLKRVVETLKTFEPFEVFVGTHPNMLNVRCSEV